MSSFPSHLVVDAWPLMEWLHGKQPGAGAFESILAATGSGEVKLSMSRINRGEVDYLIRKKFTNKWPQVERNLAKLPIELLSVPDALIDAAVRLKSEYPISFADAFAAAQAVSLRCPLLTGDEDFLKLQRDGVLEIYWVGL